MKKKLLFVIPSLDSGGGEKSLINLLNSIDYNLFDVDVMLFKRKGLFLNLVPSQVAVHEISGNYINFTKPLFPSVIAFLKQFNFCLIAHRKWFFFKHLFIKNKAIAEQKTWKNSAKSIPVFEKEFDVAIAYLEKSSIYYVVDKIKAKTKIGWIHTNYSSSGLNPKFDVSYFSKLNYLVTVSPECQQSLKDNFPKLENNIRVIHNIVSSETVLKLADEPLNDPLFIPNNFTIVTVARLSQEKGIDLAIEACKNSVVSNKQLKWYVIGDGNERAKLEQLIEEHQLQNNFFLLGLRTNPYPYLKKATIYVQPSRYEGKSIAIDEAKILAKPIIVTNFTTAKDQIEHNVTGIISNSIPTILADDILNLLNNTMLQTDLATNLKSNSFDNAFEEINKLYELING